MVILRKLKAQVLEAAQSEFKLDAIEGKEAKEAKEIQKRSSKNSC